MNRATWALLIVSLMSGSVFAQSSALPELQGSIETKLEQIAAHVTQRGKAVEQHQARKAQIEAEVETLVAGQAEHVERLSGRARSLYRLRRAGMLPVAGGFDGLMNHLSRVNRLRRMVKQDLDAAAFLKARGVALGKERDLLANTMEDLRSQIQNLEAQRQSLRDQRQGTDLFEQTLASSSSLPKHAPEELAYGRIAVRGPAGSDSGFAKMRGRLAFPIQGARRIVDASDDLGAGLEFISRPGTVVRCAADGRVAYAQAHGNHGPTVIVDHGDEYYTVYAGLGSLSVEVGDWVGMSARLGAVGGGGSDSGLYFEVRKGSRSLNARRWLGL